MATEEKGVVEYRARDGSSIKLTPQIIKKYLVSGRAEHVTDQELYIYMGLCKSRGLNPFIKDCHLVKYTPHEGAAIITSIDYYRKRARAQKDCKGWRVGIIVQGKSGELEYRNGCILLEGETLIGGWAEATPEGWTVPARKEVNLRRYIKRKNDGTVTRFWSPDNQPEQIAKVAESQLLRAVWPDEFQGLYVDSEIQSQDAQATFDQAVSTVSDTEPPGPSFDEVFAAELGDPLFPAYVKAAADHENTTVEAMREAMTGQVQAVKAGFNVYKQRLQQAAPKPTPAVSPAASPATGHQQPVITPPAEPEPARSFRDEWINLTQKGFSTYVFKNLDRFKTVDAVTRADAVAKWKKLYPQNPPPFAVVENATPETHGEGQGEAIVPEAIPDATPNAEMRTKLIRECQSYGPQVYTEAKKAMGVSEREVDWPPSISGMSRLLDECFRIEEAMKGK